jgi:hypothetical protein
MFFLARALVVIATVASGSFGDWVNSFSTSSNLFWGVMEMIPVIVLLLSFLALKKPRNSSMGRMPLLKK